MCRHVLFPQSAQPCWHTQTQIETRLTGLLKCDTSQGFQECLLFITTGAHTHTHMQSTCSHSFHWTEPPSDLFWKSRVHFQVELKLRFTLICRFSFVQTLRQAYLNNTVAPLNCKTNTAHIFAGLSAFSCFAGISECTFFSLEMNLNLAPQSRIGIRGWKEWEDDSEAADVSLAV